MLNKEMFVNTCPRHDNRDTEGRHNVKQSAHKRTHAHTHTNTQMYCGITQGFNTDHQKS